MATASGRRRGGEEEESYFISMADMMVGLVFVFIILLVYFALQYQQKSKALSDAGETRAQMLSDIRDEIRRQDPRLKVTIETETGVLHLPASILFEPSQYQLTADGRRAVETVARAMDKVVPCYTSTRPQKGCRPTAHGLDTIFIEGHTDSDPFNGTGVIKDNLDLSALRATETYRWIKQITPNLDRILNSSRQSVLSVSGYGDNRQIDHGHDEAAKSRNRRIDLRFLMETPRDEGLANMLVKPR